MRPLYYAWLEFTLWITLNIIWLWLTKGFLNWWQPLAMWVFLLLSYLITKGAGYSADAVPLVGILVFVGWLFLSRLDPTLAEKQFWGFLVAILAYIIGLFSSFPDWEAPRLLAGGSLFLLVITLLFGVKIGGAQAWLTIAGLRFQPIELSKIFFITYVAREFAKDKARLRVHLVLIAFLGLLALQRDLGPALLVYVVFCALALYSDFSWYRFLSYGFTFIGGFFGAYFLFSHFRNRVLAWIFPWSYPESQGYQIVQGLFALDAGGLTGRGFGNSLAGVIPANHTDYLFTIIGEEFGLIGTVTLILLYLALLFWAINLLAKKTADISKQIMGLGFILLLHGQVLLVIGGILRLVPFTGMTLPFVSFGSSSLVTQFFMLGLITNLGGIDHEIPTS